jgi:hypothetical protein
VFVFLIFLRNGLSGSGSHRPKTFPVQTGVPKGCCGINAVGNTHIGCGVRKVTTSSSFYVCTSTRGPIAIGGATAGVHFTVSMSALKRATGGAAHVHHAFFQISG